MPRGGRRVDPGRGESARASHVIRRHDRKPDPFRRAAQRRHRARLRDRRARCRARGTGRQALAARSRSAQTRGGRSCRGRGDAPRRARESRAAELAQQRSRVLSASVSLLPGSSATLSIPAGLSTTTMSRSKNTIALAASAPARSLGARSSTATAASGETRAAGSTQRLPSTVTRPSMHKLRARDQVAPVRSRTTAATVGSRVFVARQVVVIISGA